MEDKQLSYKGTICAKIFDNSAENDSPNRI